MKQDTLKITNVLSDPTRFSIYEYITKKREGVTVSEIAEEFSIHSNVARLHLTKLEDVSMIISELKKTGKGGRPSRFYLLSDKVIHLQFPYRDFQRLAQLSLEALADLGDEGLKALKQVGYKYGFESAEFYVRQKNLEVTQLSVQEKANCIEEIATNQGLNPEIEYVEGKEEIHFTIHNCTFKELIHIHPVSLCSMHHELFNGIFSYFFGKSNLKEEILMNDSSSHACSYSKVVLEGN
ncbi:helix-turn-helix transcriptional regulator [Halalkalibacter urbisdiaboli]|uniref:helix-turn-helix transcriptional regulator n=1 Tax=Halalkalibacter urbisdiaboli TaxID=1960589 RepID=UPI000B44B64C|nr:helix-turn-helix domain-containing protein [Halalkalibacter urbisdiaboli]